MKWVYLIFGLIFLMSYSYAIVTVVNVSITSFKMPVFTYNTNYYNSADAGTECYIKGPGGLTLIQMIEGGAEMAFRGDANVVAQVSTSTGFVEKGAVGSFSYFTNPAKQYYLRLFLPLGTYTGLVRTTSCMTNTVATSAFQAGCQVTRRASGVLCSGASTFYGVACNDSTCYSGKVVHDIVAISNCGTNSYCFPLGAV